MRFSLVNFESLHETLAPKCRKFSVLVGIVNWEEICEKLNLVEPTVEISIFPTSYRHYFLEISTKQRETRHN